MQFQFKKNLFIFTLVVLGSAHAIKAQIWPCAQYVTRQIQVSSGVFKSQISVLYKDPVTGGVGLEPVCESTTHLLNASVWYDGYIYAWRQYPATAQSGSSSTLVKLNNDCTLTEYTISFPSGTSTAQFNNAYVDASGNLYMARPGGTFPNITIYKINLNTLVPGTDPANTLTSTTLTPNGTAFTGTTNFGDMYFDGTTAYIWQNGQGLASINLTTNTYTRIGSVNEVAGSLFINSEDPGFLYGYGSSPTSTATDQNTIVKISLSTGAYTQVAAGGAAVSQSDGAGCESATFQVPPPLALSDEACFRGGNSINPTINDQAFGPATNLIDLASVNLVAPATATSIVTDAQGDIISMLIPGQGTWSVNESTGVITFTPLSTFTTGSPDPIEYTVKDIGGRVSNVAVLTNAGCPPLPVTLERYEAKLHRDKVELYWKTSSEINFSHFEIEHKTDKKERQSIAYVAQNQSSAYTYSHEQPQPGLNYYRLKMVDLDGTTEFSNWRVIDFGKDSYFATIWQSGAHIINIDTNLPASDITIFDTKGKAYSLAKSQDQATVQEIMLPKLPAGLYIIELQNSKKTLRKKLVIK